MQPRLQILLILLSLLVFFIVLELIRKGRLREEYSLIWLVSAVIIFFLSVFKGSLRLIADFVQIGYAPSFIFMVGLGLITIIQLLQTIIISKLATQNRDLAQRLAIFEWCIQHPSATKNAIENLITEPAMAGTSVDIIERVLVEDGETETLDDRSRRGDIRLAETVGPTGEATHATEVVNGGCGGEVTKYNSPHDGAGLDVLHDREESGQARPVRLDISAQR